ncbi:MAG: tetratricopeptide repeat-containing sensor histidine kinase, partial [Cytophagales bacterium]|nr:tetratricopeptide repeat-containing sensor histidine kinase [Cytophagales bacterium]
MDFQTHFREYNPITTGVWLRTVLAGMIVLASYQSLVAQQPSVDSLNVQAARLLETEPEKALNLSLQSVQTALRTNYLSGHTQALVLAGRAYHHLNNPSKALLYFSRALEKATARRQEPEAADANEWLGQVYYGFGDYNQASNHFFASLRIREKIRDQRGVAQSRMQIGMVYAAWRKPDKALEYYERSLGTWEQLKDPAGLATVLNHLGRLYDQRGDYAAARQHLERSLSIHQKQKNARGIAQTLHSIGDVHFHQQRYEQAINYYFRSLKREQRLRLPAAMARSYNSIAACYAATGRHQQAVFYYDKAVAQGRRTQSREPLMNAYQGLAASQASLRNFQAAYENHRTYAALRDSIFDSRASVQIAETEAKYRLENQQHEVELLRKERRINNLTLRENRNLTYLLGVLAAVLLVLVIVEASRYRIKQRAGRMLEARNQIINRQNADLQQANEKLMQSEADLHNLIATRDKFFTIVSHDLRGPLASLTGLFQLLLKHLDRFDKNELKKFVGDMNGTVKSVQNLLENLLHWSRTQRGGIRYEPARQSLTDLVQDVLLTFGPMATNKDINLRVDVPPGSQVYADANMLQFVLRNLLDNAVKFTHAGGGITLAASPNEEGFVEITVSDTGVGIAPNDLAKLFRIDTYH